MSLKSRIERLESSERFIQNKIMLTMPDGRQEVISGSGDFLFQILGNTQSGGNLTSEQKRMTELIRESVTNSIEPEGGDLVGLIRALLNSEE